MKRRRRKEGTEQNEKRVETFSQEILNIFIEDAI